MAITSNQTETIQLTKAGEGAGPGGWDINVAPAPTWVGSLTFLSNRAPPNAPVNLQPVFYYTSADALRFAGYPATTPDQYAVSETGFDLWVRHINTSGTVQLTIDPSIAQVAPTTTPLVVSNGIVQSAVVLGKF